MKNIKIRSKIYDIAKIGFSDHGGNDYITVIDYLKRHKDRLSYTVSGYGTKIPTQYKVISGGYARRVYCDIYSNVGSCYFFDSNKNKVYVN